MLKHLLVAVLVVGLGAAAAHAGKAGVLVAGLVAFGFLIVGATRLAGHDSRAGVRLMAYAVLFQFSVGFTAFGVLQEGGGLQSAEELRRNALLALPALLFVATLFAALYLGMRPQGGLVQDADRAFDRTRESGREAILAERAGESARAEELWRRAEEYARHCGLGGLERGELRRLVDPGPD